MFTGLDTRAQAAHGGTALKLVNLGGNYALVGGGQLCALQRLVVKVTLVLIRVTVLRRQADREPRQANACSTALRRKNRERRGTPRGAVARNHVAQRLRKPTGHSPRRRRPARTGTRSPSAPSSSCTARICSCSAAWVPRQGRGPRRLPLRKLPLPRRRTVEGQVWAPQHRRAAQSHQWTMKALLGAEGRAWWSQQLQDGTREVGPKFHAAGSAEPHTTRGGLTSERGLHLLHGLSEALGAHVVSGRGAEKPALAHNSAGHGAAHTDTA